MLVYKILQKHKKRKNMMNNIVNGKNKKQRRQGRREGYIWTSTPTAIAVITKKIIQRNRLL